MYSPSQHLEPVVVLYREVYGPHTASSTLHTMGDLTLACNVKHITMVLEQYTAMVLEHTAMLLEQHTATVLEQHTAMVLEHTAMVLE